MNGILETVRIVWDSLVRAIYEVSFSLLPVFLYAVVLILIEKSEKVYALPGWAFASFSIFSLMMRDSIRAFRHRAEDETNRLAATFISIVGLGLSGVMMTLSILRANGDIELPLYFDTVVYVLLKFGFLFSIFVKSILIQRDQHGRIV